MEQREIKFRVFDVHKKVMHTTDVNSYMSIDDNGKVNSFSGISDHVVMQYSGLRDKNGKEIFEGDVVKFIDAKNHSTESGDNWEDELCYGAIWFDTEAGRWECTNRLSIGIDQFIEEIQSNCEISGNIYEHLNTLT